MVPTPDMLELQQRLENQSQQMDHLTDERNRYRAILDTLPVGVYMVDADYRIEYMNPALTALFGDPDERPCYRKFHGRNSACLFCKNPDVFSGRNVRWQTTLTDGRTFDLLDRPFRHPDGHISKLEIVHDITELHTTQRNFQEAAALSQVGYWEWRKADDKLTWNDQTYRCYGYEPGEIEPTLEFTGRHSHPEDKTHFKQALEYSLATGKTYQVEFRFYTKNGELRWGRANGTPSFDDHGRLLGFSGTMQDITSLRRSAQQLQLAFQASPFAIIIDRLDDGRITYVNDKFTEWFGWSADEFIGRQGTTQEIWPAPQLRQIWLDSLLQHDGTLADFESFLMDCQGHSHQVNLSSAIIRIDEADHVLTFIQDISERKANEQRIEYLAQHDMLTGLPNRVLFRERFQLAMAWAERNQTQVALMFVDLDHFKTINDTLGHPVGDALLRQLTQRLQSNLRHTDTLGRLGGDEFLIALTDIKHPDEVALIANKVVELLVRPFQIEEHELSLTLSVGISLWPIDGNNFDRLLQQADTAMYQAKAAGRNTYRFYTAAMNQEAMESLQLRNALRKAIDQNEFELHYQPQIELSSRRLIGVEALLRWQRPELDANGQVTARSAVPPARFIPLAEETGLIVPIGAWLLKEACQQAVRWQNSGLPPLVMAVNLSAVQFRRGELEEQVMDALSSSGLSPQLLELELTESLLLDDTETALASARRFKAMGIRLAIDDFGTGYSSLAYLKRFAVDKLKIDQSFIRDIANDPEDAAIVRAIISLADSFKLKVIAEGVETEEISRLLELQRCDEVQGYLYAQPMPAHELPAWYAHWQKTQQKN